LEKGFVAGIVRPLVLSLAYTQNNNKKPQEFLNQLKILFGKATHDAFMLPDTSNARGFLGSVFNQT
jgi:hypothetical protein